MPNKKYIIGIVEGNKSGPKKFYEALLTTFDTNIVGDFSKSHVFNIVDDDIRPCLIIETTDFILINLHAPWAKALYNKSEHQYKDISFNKINQDHLNIAGKYLFNKIYDVIKKEFLFENKEIIFMGDFNDTNGGYLKVFKDMMLRKFQRQLYTCEKTKTCCISEMGSNILTATEKLEMIGYGDYILSTLKDNETFIPLYDANTDELIKIKPDNNKINLEIIKTNPMSDYLPLVVQLNFKKNDSKGKGKGKGGNKTKNKKTKNKETKKTKKTKNKETKKTKTRQRKKQI